MDESPRAVLIRSSGKTRQHESIAGAPKIGRGSCRSTGVDGVGPACTATEREEQLFDTLKD